VILTTSTATTRAVRDATHTIPIVFVGLSDPVATGIVSNLAQPTANVTGFSLYEHSMSGKWLNLLKDMVPQSHGSRHHVESGHHAVRAVYLRSGQQLGKHLALQGHFCRHQAYARDRADIGRDRRRRRRPRRAAEWRLFCCQQRGDAVAGCNSEEKHEPVSDIDHSIDG